VLCVETVGKIRRWYKVEGRSISEIARRLGASRNTIKKYVRNNLIEPQYKQRAKRYPVIGPWVSRLALLLAEDAGKLKRERRTGCRLFEQLQEEGYSGSYVTLQRFVRAWKREQQHNPGQVFIPLVFAPGEAYQFDWSYETVELGGHTTQVKLAHLRLCHSRVFFITAYLREAQEMVFDAHGRAFSCWGGVAKRGIYDNLKSAVDLIFSGKERRYNRRFLQMCSHYLIEAVACTPGAGWEKGQVENQVGLVRERIFTPRLKCASLPELNELLARKCWELAAKLPHPEQPDCSRGEVFERDEKPALLPLSSVFDGFTERECRVSATSLVHYDRNRYSVDCRYAGKTVSVRAYADRIVMVADGQIVGEHPRSFEREKTFFDPWHYLLALENKPGALRNGAPFKDWALPAPIQELRGKLLARPGGDRQFVSILNAIRSDGLEAVAIACELALEAKAASSDYVLNALNRLKPGTSPEPVVTAESLTLKEEPKADTARYDRLLGKLQLLAIAMAPMLAAASSRLIAEVSHGAP
jgi:transposase